MAWQCYYRFNQQFVGPFAHSSQQSTPSPLPIQPIPTALIATSQRVYDSTWYPDSGASNHLTSNINHLTNRTEYGEPDQVYIANGTGIPIKHIDCAQV